MTHPRIRAFAVAARTAREDAGLGQREVSRVFDWSVGKLSRIESGDRAKLPTKAEVEMMDTLYKTEGRLLTIAGYRPGGLPDDLDAALRGIVEHHVNELLEDVRLIFDPDN